MSLHTAPSVQVALRMWLRTGPTWLSMEPLAHSGYSVFILLLAICFVCFLCSRCAGKCIGPGGPGQHYGGSRRGEEIECCRNPMGISGKSLFHNNQYRWCEVVGSVCYRQQCLEFKQCRIRIRSRIKSAYSYA